MADFSSDLGELFTNPGLIAKAIGAGMGNWGIPYNNGYGRVLVGPRLSALGDVLMAARQGSEEKDRKSVV